jgi:hypothetical protein
MKKNVGGFDRGFRIAVGLVVIGLGVFYRSWWGALGLLPLLTGVLRWCPVYLPSGTSTYVEKSAPGRSAEGDPRHRRPV